MERYLYGAIKSQEDESVRHAGIAVSLHGLGNLYEESMVSVREHDERAS